MVEIRHIATSTDISPEGNYVLVCCGPVARDRGHPRGRTIVVRDGKRDQAKLKEFKTALEIARSWAEANRYPTVYVMDMPGFDDTAE